MSGAVTGALIGGAVAGVGGMITGGMLGQKQPKLPKPVEPAPLPQAAQTPDQAAVRRSSGGGTGFSKLGTMLTGGGGIDPGALLLGKNKLLGQ